MFVKYIVIIVFLLGHSLSAVAQSIDKTILDICISNFKSEWKVSSKPLVFKQTSPNTWYSESISLTESGDRINSVKRNYLEVLNRKLNSIDLVECKSTTKIRHYIGDTQVKSYGLNSYYYYTGFQDEPVSLENLNLSEKGINGDTIFIENGHSLTYCKEWGEFSEEACPNGSVQEKKVSFKTHVLYNLEDKLAVDSKVVDYGGTLAAVRLIGPHNFEFAFFSKLFGLHSNSRMVISRAGLDKIRVPYDLSWFGDAGDISSTGFIIDYHTRTSSYEIVFFKYKHIPDEDINGVGDIKTKQQTTEVSAVFEVRLDKDHVKLEKKKLAKKDERNYLKRFPHPPDVRDPSR